MIKYSRGLVIEVLRESFLKVFKDSLVSLVLFGSWARGDAGKWSDIDVLVVLEELPNDRFVLHKLLDRVEDLARPKLEELGIDPPPPISPIVLDRVSASKPRLLYLDLVTDAVIIYDKDNFFRKVLDKFKDKLRELGAERKRIGKKWYWVLKKDYDFGEVFSLEQ